ncbi:retinol dehydrogenase 13 isoform X1 [Linepithema humile]|uniref:retinol dehydrogenase 13 isoform X1 n=2 Tax=Linepithema humile TaxID=83485 RepID=UPI00351E0DE1
MNSYDEFFNILQFNPLSDSYWPYLISLCIGLITVIRMYMGGPMCLSDDHIDDKLVIITGASSGMGKEIALELARRGGHIILAVRDMEAGEKVAQQIRDVSGRDVEVRAIDLSSLKSVQNFVDQLDTRKVDILVNNAGIVFHPFEKTTEGFEMHFVTNYLGHFLLTHLLLPKLHAAEQGRIINLSSQAHTISTMHLQDLNLEENFTAREAFGQSKLALILMARHMSRLLKDTDVTINAVNPGIVRGTRHMRYSPLNSAFLIKLIMRPWMWLFLKNAVQGAQTAVYAAVAKELSKHSGKYFSDCEMRTPSVNAVDDVVAEKLYSKSLALVKSYMRKSYINHEG